MTLFSFVGSLTVPASTGNQAITGVGFQPKVVIFWGNEQTANGSSLGAAQYVGVGISSTARVSGGGMSPNGGAQGARFHDNTHVFGYVNNVGATLRIADFVSMDSDGFTLNWNAANASAYRIHYVAIKGPKFAVGATTQPTSNGNVSVTGLAFAPKAVMLVGNGGAASTTLDNADGNLSIGASDGTNQFAIWTGNGAASCAQVLDRTKAITFYTPNTPTKNAEASLSSLNSDGFTLNWTTTNATAREVLYLAIGATVLAATIQWVKDSIEAALGPEQVPAALMDFDFDDLRGLKSLALWGQR